MKRIILLMALLLLPFSAHASDADQKATYWFSDDAGFTGWTIQNVAIDIPVYGSDSTTAVQAQKAGISNIACNAVILDGGLLRRPEGREANYSFGVTYPDSVSATILGTALPPLGWTLQKTIAYLIVNQIYKQRAEYSLGDTLTFLRTVVDSAGANATTIEATFP